jgi:hypothetical protein
MVDNCPPAAGEGDIGVVSVVVEAILFADVSTVGGSGSTIDDSDSCGANILTTEDIEADGILSSR